MIKDTKISEIFQIPTRMLQRWKNSNDYRFLIYTYLHNSDTAEVEAFFKYLASKKAGNYDDSDEEVLALKFLYKKDFISLVQKHINQYLKQDDIKVYSEKNLGSLLEQSNSLEIGGSSLLIKVPKSSVVYVEIGSRVLEQKPLLARIDSIKSHLKDDLFLKKMLFITNEKKLPGYLRESNMVDGVIIENINIDTFSGKYLGINKIIFVPSTMKIPNIS